VKPRDKPASCSGCPAADWGVGFVEADNHFEAQAAKDGFVMQPAVLFHGLYLLLQVHKRLGQK